MTGAIALIDCNDFYVSCERVFAPRRLGRPVAVLSNNDGCVISRSEEAKRLGIGMGAPYFKNRRVIEEHGRRRAHRRRAARRAVPSVGDVPQAKRSVTCSRSFGELTGSLEDLRDAPSRRT